MPPFPPCHRTVRVTTFTFQFLPSVLHCHTTLGQQNGNSVYLVQEGVSAELFHLFMKLKKHLDIYLKLHNTENMFLICSICRMTCCNNHLQHSAFTLPAAAAHDPGHLHHHSVVCSLHRVQVQLCYSSGHSFPDVRDVDYLETTVGIHFLTITRYLI